MAYKKLKIICDADDVLLSCNEYALQLLSQTTGTYYNVSKIIKWGELGNELDERMQFLEYAEFYSNQPALPGAKEFLHSLMEKAEVFIATAVYPEFMGERIQRIMELFPEFPMDHIIMGKRKDLFHADIMLDDGIHNLLESNCSLPVLFRQPWNQNSSGICTVDGYTDFLTLVDFMNGNKTNISRLPKIICIVGPSGNRKRDLATALCESDKCFELIKTCTTAKGRKNNTEMISSNFFDLLFRQREFIETTWYCGERYGTKKRDIDQALGQNRYPVLVMDISGCLSVYNTYPGQCEIIYADRDKRECILSIIQKPALKREQVADRIVSFEFEEKNKILADHIVSVGDGCLESEVADILSYLKL